MNSPFAIEQAQKVIQNMHPHPSKIDQEDGLDALFRRIFSRDPDAEERSLAREYLHRAQPATRWESLAQALMMSNEMLYVD